MTAVYAKRCYSKAAIQQLFPWETSFTVVRVNYDIAHYVVLKPIALETPIDGLQLL